MLWGWYNTEFLHFWWLAGLCGLFCFGFCWPRFWVAVYWFGVLRLVPRGWVFVSLGWGACSRGLGVNARVGFRSLWIGNITLLYFMWFLAGIAYLQLLSCTWINWLCVFTCLGFAAVLSGYADSGFLILGSVDCCLYVFTLELGLGLIWMLGCGCCLLDTGWLLIVTWSGRFFLIYFGRL